MTLELQGHHLGARHKYLNSLSKTIKQENVSYDDIDISAGDIINIVKIDLACMNRNVNYILIVLQCEDIFYVSRALKKCHWLFSDIHYEYIINPEYLHEVLYPKMTSKAATKLKKYVKLNLKDCQRVEKFYTYEKNEKEALEWLPHCSPEFIVNNLKKHIHYVDISMLKRLCEKTTMALKIYLDNNQNYYMKQNALKATTFLLKYDLPKYLDLVEEYSEFTPNFNSRCTKYILGQDASRIMNNFQIYSSVIDIKVFLNHIQRENIKCFLYKLFESNKSNEINCIQFEMLVKFLKAMPEADCLEIVKQVFLEKIHLIEDKCPLPKPLRISMNNLYTFMYTNKWRFIYDHYWYRFTSFEFAYPQIVKIISNETSVEEINSIVETLTILVSNSKKNILELVDYFCREFKNKKTTNIKKSIIKNILKLDLEYLHENLWEKLKNTFMIDILNETTESINYEECYVQLCIEFIIIYEVLYMPKISDIIQKKFKFNSLKLYQKKLPEHAKNKLFSFLLNFITDKINSQSTITKKDFLNKFALLDNALNLLNDWNKKLGDYPQMLDMVTELMRINEENSWDVDFSKIYNKKKSWRRDLFKISLHMYPSQPVLLNILKHDPTLLENFSQIQNKVYGKGVSLDQYHKKLKIFWPESISRQLIHTCEQQLRNGNSNKAIIRALCICMKKETLIQLLLQYKPQEDVINWATVDEQKLNIQHNLAMNMHIARPQPGPEIVIDYAKGDHLPFAVPALYSIFYNLNFAQSHKFIPMLLNNKVSLQKHGIRLAFMKLSPLDVKTILTNVLKNNKNLTIRHVGFELTFKALCKQNDSARIQYFWPIMDNFLNDLTYQENKAIYDLLFEIEKLPLSVQSQFFPKAFKFLKGLMLSNNDYYEDMKYSFKNLITYASENINILSPVFIKSMLLEYINDELPQKVDTLYNNSKIKLLSAFILYSDTRECLAEKCQTLLIPFLRKCFKHWNNIYKGEENNEITKEPMYFARICFHAFITTFSIDARNFISEKNTIVPSEAFQTIKNELDQSVDTSSYYLTLTLLEVNYTFLVIFESCKQDGDDWNKTCSRMLPKWAKILNHHLKEHCSIYFSNVYVLFERALYTLLTRYLSNSLIFELLQYILQNEKFIPLYLMVLKLIQHHSHNILDEDTKVIQDLFATVSSHTSPEVQIHYYQCRNIHLKSIPDYRICNKIKKEYDIQIEQVDS